MSGVYYGSPEQDVSQSSGLPAIPPERVGLNGEYDHYGLAKRVKAHLDQHFEADVASRLVIRQRGSAILLSGKVATWQMAERLAYFILDVQGATQVELHHLQVIDAWSARSAPHQLVSAQV